MKKLNVHPFLLAVAVVLFTGAPVMLPAQNYVSGTVFTADTAVVYQSTFNNAIVGVEIEVSGSGTGLFLTGMSLDVSLCTNFTTDVSVVKVFYTGGDSTFHPDSLFWSGSDVLNGVTGSQRLLEGKNYFWVAFNITNYAVENDTMDVACNALFLTDGLDAHVPLVTSPAGNRLVKPYLILPRTISGYLRYDNPAGTPLTNVQLLLNSGLTQKQTTTDATGFYEFGGLMPGTYYLDPVCVKPWGGVNAVDALALLKHFVGIIPLSGLPLLAADLDISGYINSNDALLVLRRFTGLTDYFPLGDWIFETTVIPLDGSGNIEQDIRGLCTGDVNRTHVPSP